MLGSSQVVAFIITTDSAKALAFYEGILGLRFVSEDPFALVMNANGNTVRIAKMEGAFTPAKQTVLGWEVADIEAKVTEMSAAGVNFEKYGFPGQDERGVWTTPNGSKVAWFKDPDGNVLSVSQHP